MLNLDFAGPAKISFNFLVTEYNFKLVQANDFLILYESDKIFVNVRFDNDRSYELDVELGERDALFNGRERPFSLTEVLRLKGAPAKDSYRCIMTSTQPVLVKFIAGLADRLKRYGAEFLDADKMAFEQLGDQREREGLAYAADQESTAVRRAVKDAWKEKDYHKIVELYESIEPHILPSERKKLEYARKKT